MNANLRYLLYAVVTLAVLAWVFTSDSPGTAATSRPPAKKAAQLKPNGELDVSMLKAPPFAKLKVTARDIFLPALFDDSTTPKVDDGDNKLPADIAGGDGNWTFTGIAEIDGLKYALLENGSKKESGFVKEGDLWKKSKVVHISPDSIAFIGPDGMEETVLRYSPSTKTASSTPPTEAAPEAGPGFQPAQPNMRGLRGRMNGGPQMMMGGGMPMVEMQGG